MFLIKNPIWVFNFNDFGKMWFVEQKEIWHAVTIGYQGFSFNYGPYNLKYNCYNDLNGKWTYLESDVNNVSEEWY